MSEREQKINKTEVDLHSGLRYMPHHAVDAIYTVAVYDGDHVEFSQEFFNIFMEVRYIFKFSCQMTWHHLLMALRSDRSFMIRRGVFAFYMKDAELARLYHCAPSTLVRVKKILKEHGFLNYRACHEVGVGKTTIYEFDLKILKFIFKLLKKEFDRQEAYIRRDDESVSDYLNKKKARMLKLLAEGVHRHSTIAAVP